MNILLLDGSPKAQGSASAHFLKALEEMLGGEAAPSWQNARTGGADQAAEALLTCDALVLAFPLYADGIPSHLLAFLEGLEQRLRGKECGAAVYALCNAGFYDARQTHLALDMVKVWSDKCGLAWGRGIGIGGGGMASAAQVGKGPWTRLGKEFEALIGLIRQKSSAPDAFVEPNFPRFLYKFMAHMGWRIMARRNGVKPYELGRKREYRAL